MKTRVTSRRKLALLWVSCAVTLILVNNAKAHPFPINLAIADQRELGQVHPAIPQGDADITQYVNFMISLSLGESGHVNIGPHDIRMTRSINNFGALPGAAALTLRGTGAKMDLGLQGTYNYLFARYGGPRGGFAEVWFVGNLSGIITIPATWGRYGLSGWALFTGTAGVPDSGATGMLLGAALGALGVMRRYLLRNVS